MGGAGIVSCAGFSYQTAGPVAALVATPGQGAAASDRAECPLSGLGRSGQVAQFALAGPKAGLRTAGPGLAGALWLSGASGGNLRRSAALSRHLLQSRRLGAVGADAGVRARLAGLLHRYQASQATLGASLGRGRLGASPGRGVASRVGRLAGSPATGLSGAHSPVGLALGALSQANDRSTQGQGSAPQTGQFLNPDRFGGGCGLQRAARGR